MPDNAPGRPFGLSALAAAYLFFLLASVSSYGTPFPLLGTLHQGRTGEFLVFVDCLVSLHIFMGILKRQRLTLWLLIAYNCFDVLNACVNLALLPPGAYALQAGTPIPQDELRVTTLAVALGLMVLNLLLLRNVHLFDNRSPYLL